MIRFNANLFRIAMLCASNEKTRYHLRGVYIQPHAIKGVTMTATDGTKLLVLYDENGFADESAIVQLTPDALKACKLGRNERRDVVIATGCADAVVNIVGAADENATIDSPVAFSKDCKVDGTYPDYCRVFPAAIEFTQDSRSPSFGTFVLASMNSVAVELAKHYSSSSKGGVLRINAASDNSPALVTFPPTFNAVAVAMPMRSLCESAQPEWFTVVASVAQAAE